jgi:ABC-type antimicrobial peptide transport system permease subunit
VRQSLYPPIKLWEGSRMNKFIKRLLLSLLFIICIIGMISGGIYMVIETGYSFRTMHILLGFKGILISFIIGIIYLVIVLYLLYRLDLKVRRIIKNEKI